ncbi:MAG: tRNA glutamyl-Q(34) synthetase GluQRS [Phascolarctobacterium sp.]|nr:tRNA glutamyl-Q(34) synthetase GluQRS [Phascolarctobacterium sp.]
MSSAVIGRFAPTPSGFLHLGNVFCSLLAWLFAKSQGGKIVLRIEDLDPARCSVEKADRLAKDLAWLGLNWDEGAYVSKNHEDYFQSNRFSIYQKYFAQLEANENIYSCFCSRNELHAANAPHLSDGRFIYAGTCRNLSLAERQEKMQMRKPSYRLKVKDEDISFVDGIYGRMTYNLANESGDFIVRRSDGVYAYQLAVVIDDALMHVNQVVRGSDLLSSTAMQLYLYDLLELKVPSFTHIPLLVAPDGRRLAKRDEDMELDVLRKKLQAPEKIIGWLAFLAGQIHKYEPLKAEDLLHIFDPKKIPQANIIVPQELLNL